MSRVPRRRRKKRAAGPDSVARRVDKRYRCAIPCAEFRDAPDSSDGLAEMRSLMKTSLACLVGVACVPVVLLLDYVGSSAAKTSPVRPPDVKAADDGRAPPFAGQPPG